MSSRPSRMILRVRGCRPEASGPTFPRWPTDPALEQRAYRRSDGPGNGDGAWMALASGLTGRQSPLRHGVRPFGCDADAVLLPPSVCATGAAGGGSTSGWRRWTQRRDRREGLAEQRARHHDLGHLKGDRAAMPDDLGADLDQPVPLRPPTAARAIPAADQGGERMGVRGPGLASLPPDRMRGGLLATTGLS